MLLITLFALSLISRSSGKHVETWKIRITRLITKYQAVVRELILDLRNWEWFLFLTCNESFWTLEDTLQNTSSGQSNSLPCAYTFQQYCFMVSEKRVCLAVAKALCHIIDFYCLCWGSTFDLGWLNAGVVFQNSVWASSVL